MKFQNITTKFLFMMVLSVNVFLGSSPKKICVGGAAAQGNSTANAACTANVLNSFSETTNKLENSAAFRSYVNSQLDIVKSDDVLNWLNNPCAQLPETIQKKFTQFNDTDYKQYVQNLASFTGGGAKGLMEIISIVVIEEILNQLPQDVREIIINRRVTRYWKANSKPVGENSDQIIQNIEKRLKQDKYIYFQDVVDEFSGTSTGAIIAAGLAYMAPITSNDSSMIIGFSRYKAYEVAQIYYRHLSDIFTSSGLTSTRCGLMGAQYDKDNLRNMLTVFFGDKTFTQAFPNKNIMIALAEIDINLVPTLSIAKVGDIFWENQPVAKAVEGSASAPTYFKRLDFGGKAFVDGGICANSLVKELAIDALINSHELLNILSFGAGKTDNIEGNLPKEYKDTGWVRSAVKILEKSLDGQVKDVHTYCLELVRNGRIRSFTHLNPVLCNGMELDSVSTDFINNCFKQTKEALNTNKLLSTIMKQLLNFIPDNELRTDYNFESIWARAYFKILLLDFTKARMLAEEGEGEGEKDKNETDSKICFRQHNQSTHAAEAPFLKMYISRLSDNELVRILRSTIDKNPFGNFPSENSLDFEGHARNLSNYLRSIYDENDQKKLNKIIQGVIDHKKDKPNFAYAPEFDLLSDDYEVISKLDANDINNHAAALHEIFDAHGNAYRAEHKLHLLFSTYVKTVFSEKQISEEDLTTITGAFDKAMSLNNNSYTSSLVKKIYNYSTNEAQMLCNHFTDHNAGLAQRTQIDEPMRLDAENNENADVVQAAELVAAEAGGRAELVAEEAGGRAELVAEAEQRAELVAEEAAEQRLRTELVAEEAKQRLRAELAAAQQQLAAEQCLRAEAEQRAELVAEEAAEQRLRTELVAEEAKQRLRAELAAAQQQLAAEQRLRAEAEEQRAVRAEQGLAEAQQQLAAEQHARAAAEAQQQLARLRETCSNIERERNALQEHMNNVEKSKKTNSSGR